MIKRILNRLPKSSRRALMLAFNECDSLIIKLEDNKFIGVNVVINNQFTVLEQHGVWTVGEFHV